jgi:hypothetical protein
MIFQTTVFAPDHISEAIKATEDSLSIMAIITHAITWPPFNLQEMLEICCTPRKPVLQVVTLVLWSIEVNATHKQGDSSCLSDPGLPLFLHLCCL